MDRSSRISGVTRLVPLGHHHLVTLEGEEAIEDDHEEGPEGDCPTDLRRQKHPEQSAHKKPLWIDLAAARRAHVLVNEVSAKEASANEGDQIGEARAVAADKSR